MDITANEVAAHPAVDTPKLGDKIKSAWEWLSRSKIKEEERARDRLVLYQDLDKVIDGPAVKEPELKVRVREAFHRGNREIAQALSYHLQNEAYLQLNDPDNKAMNPKLREQLRRQKNMAQALASNTIKQMRKEGKDSRAIYSFKSEDWQNLLIPQSPVITSPQADKVGV